MFGLRLQNSCRVAIVDDEDAARCSRLKWKLMPNGHVAGYFHREPITLERFVMNYFDDDPREVSHIDGDCRDCRKQNLQACKKNINYALPPAKIHRVSTDSKYRGVSWSYAMKQWEARIDLAGKSEHLMYSPNEDVAAAAYDLAVLQNFRKVDPAMLNFDLEEYGLTREHLL